MARLFHYTHASALERIVGAGHLDPRTVLRKGDRPAVWFSFSESFEPTAIPVVVGKPALSFEEFAATSTPIRIEVDQACAPHGWPYYKGMHPQWAALLEMGWADGMPAINLALWRFSFDPVPVEAFRSLEGYSKGQWQRFSMEDFKNACLKRTKTG